MQLILEEIDTMTEDALIVLADTIALYGFPIISAIGLAYFVYYIWNWVTEKVEPVISESSETLLALIDRVRMLDNDLIRLKTKLDMILQQQAKDANKSIWAEESKK